VAAQVSDWLQGWTEPSRPRSRHAAEHFQRNASWFGIATSAFLRDWYRPLSEPVRSRPPLPRGSIPVFFETINYVQYSLTVTETGDTVAMTFAEYTLKKIAHVAIREVRVADLAHVSIRDLKDYNP